MVDPDVLGPKDGDAITIGFGTPSPVGGAGAHVGLTPRQAVVDVDVVDDDIAYILESDAGPTGDVNVSTSAVYSLEAVHYQLLF